MSRPRKRFASLQTRQLGGRVYGEDSILSRVRVQTHGPPTSLALLSGVHFVRNSTADAGRLSLPAIPFPESFEPLAQPAPLSLWCSGYDDELAPGVVPKRRMSRNAFFLTPPHRRPVHTKVANRILILERWSGYLKRLARMDFEAKANPFPVPASTSATPVRRGRGRPRQGRVSV
jgi:hypothetical protein